MDLIRCTSTEQVRQQLAGWILEHDWAPGKWVRGVGYMWIWDKMGGRSKTGISGPPLINRWDLERPVEVAGKRVDLGRYPTYLFQLSGHYASANALALEKARILDRSGGFYAGRNNQCLTVRGKTVQQAFSPGRHAFGSFFSISDHGGSKQLDGMIFHHYAMEEFFARAVQFGGYPRLDGGEVTAALRQRAGEFLRMGTTSIYDNNLRVPALLDEIKSFSRHAKAEDKIRLSFYPYICHATKGAYPAFDSGVRKGVISSAPLFDNAWVRLAGYKLQMDAGTMTGLTWDPNRSLGDPSKGKLNLWEYQDFLRMISELHRRGAQISVHVAGDKALDWTLDAFEKTAVGGSDRRHRIEHLPCTPEWSRNGIRQTKEPLLPRAAGLDLVFCPQPGFILYYAQFFEQAFGPGVGPKKQHKIYPRMTHSLPYRSAVEAGIPVALSSDNPCVINASPLLALWESVHRRTRPLRKGAITYVESTVYNHPDARGRVVDERVDFTQALRGHTIDAAYAGQEEQIKGSIEPGKLADLVIWNRDLRELGERLPIKHLLQFKPVLTVVDGRVAYQDTASVRLDQA